MLSDEDQEQEPDRCCSHTAWGQEFWLIPAQWTWNLRLELGHALHPASMRTTEFAQACTEPATKPGDACRQMFPTSRQYGRSRAWDVSQANTSRLSQTALYSAPVFYA